MSRDSATIMRCRLCGRLYKFYTHMVGDQTVCPRCRAEADREMEHPR